MFSHALSVNKGFSNTGFSSKNFSDRKPDSKGLKNSEIISADAQQKISDYVRGAIGEATVLDDIEAVSESDFELGEKLGQGAFAEVRAIRWQDSVEKNTQPYVLKRLKFDASRGDPVRAAADIVIEAVLLSRAHHVNVINMHGASGQMLKADAAYGLYYIVLDRLKETLNGRIKRWNIFALDASGRGDNSPAEKTRIVKAVASGLSYLHDHRMIHRDIKPDNIGFDLCNDEVKILDFGVGRYLPGQDKNKAYLMTGLVGSRRYMAPEVILCKPYGLAADVYAWAMLAAETFSQQAAFKGYSMQSHRKAVCNHHSRPACSNMPRHLRRIVKSAWQPEPTKRPAMEMIEQTVDQPQRNGWFSSMVGKYSGRLGFR